MKTEASNENRGYSKFSFFYLKKFLLCAVLVFREKFSTPAAAVLQNLLIGKDVRLLAFWFIRITFCKCSTEQLLLLILKKQYFLWKTTVIESFFMKNMKDLSFGPWTLLLLFSRGFCKIFRTTLSQNISRVLFLSFFLKLERYLIRNSHYKLSLKTTTWKKT